MPSPVQAEHATKWYWGLLALAVLPGFLYPPLGIVTAATAAWFARHNRRWLVVFAVIAVLWLLNTTLFMAWGGGGRSTGS